MTLTFVVLSLYSDCSSLKRTSPKNQHPLPSPPNPDTPPHPPTFFSLVVDDVKIELHTLVQLFLLHDGPLQVQELDARTRERDRVILARRLELKLHCRGHLRSSPRALDTRQRGLHSRPPFLPLAPPPRSVSSCGRRYDLQYSVPVLGCRRMKRKTKTLYEVFL